MDTPVRRTLWLSSNTSLPSGSLSCPCPSLWTEGSQWNPLGVTVQAQQAHLLPKEKILVGCSKLSDVRTPAQGCTEQSCRVLCKFVLQIFFLFLGSTNILTRLVRPGGDGHPQPQEKSCPWLSSFMPGVHLSNTHRSEVRTPLAQRQGDVLERSIQTLTLVSEGFFLPYCDLYIIS